VPAYFFVAEAGATVAHGVRVAVAALWALAMLLAFDPPRSLLLTLHKLNWLVFGWADRATPIKASAASRTGVKRFAMGAPIAVADIKAVCKKASCEGRKCTVNDMVMGAVGGGIHRYAQLHRHATGDAPTLEARLLTIVNTRAARGLRDAAQMLEDYRTARWGNEFSYFIINLDVGAAAAPAERLLSAQCAMAKLKRSPEGLIVHLVNKAVWRLAGTAGLKRFALFLFGKMQTFVSNLAAPPHALRFAGSPLRRLANCTAPLQFGCTFNVLSYNGQLVVSTACDEGVVPDPHALLQCVGDEFAAMMQSELALASASASPPVAAQDIELAVEETAAAQAEA
jgi:hypothetical protein